MHPGHLHAPPAPVDYMQPCAQQRQCRACIAPLAWARHCMLGNRMADLATVNAVKGYRRCVATGRERMCCREDATAEAQYRMAGRGGRGQNASKA